MNRRTLLKGLASLPFLRHLKLEEAAPSWEMKLAEEGLLTGDGREIDGGTLDLGVTHPPICEPLFRQYVMFYETFEGITRPIRDSLSAIGAPRGGIRFIKAE